MSEALRLSWAIARMAWRATYNRTFRFSKVKGALVMLVLQLIFFLLIARRAPVMASGAANEGLGGLVALISLQMAWFGMMWGFTRGQFQLYQGLLVPLFQITPARPIGFLLGRVIEAVPIRSWSTLLWAYVYSGVVAGPARWGAMALLFIVGLGVGMIAHLSGLLLLSFWSRYSPKTMRNGLILFGGVTLGFATWAVIYLASGGTVTELALNIRAYRFLVFGAVVLVTGIPGAMLLAALAIRPAAVEDLYRQGVYKVIELNDSDVTRPGRSLWLPIPDNVFRPILSREWLELSRSKVAQIQLAIWGAGTVGVWFAGRAIQGAPMERVIQYVGALALLTWFMSYGHWVVRVFEKERKTNILYRLAGVSTPKLLAAKFTSIFVPSGFLVGATTLVGAAAAELGFAQVLTVWSWSIGALAAGVIGGFGMAAATAGESEDEQDAGGSPGRGEGGGQQPAGTDAWWSLARTVALAVTAGLPIWFGAGQPGLPFRVPEAGLWAVSVLLPVGLMVVGYRLMVRAWERV